MKKLLILSVLFLAACSDVPIKSNWPNVPADLKTPCADLKKIDEGTTKLSVVVDKVVENYYLYHECSSKVNDWIEWYERQKEIQESIK